MPYGNMSFTNENYVHLSSEQALADYAQLLTSLKSNMSIPTAPVISFGGSYGGMLTAWFRKKYPHITAGAIAGSAPIWFFNSEKKYPDIILVILAFVITSFSPTDLFPRYLREHFVQPYVLKAVPCILIWAKITYDLLLSKNKYA